MLLVIVPSPVHFQNNLKSHTIVPLKFVLQHFINSSHIIYSYTSEWQIQWEQPDEDYKKLQDLTRPVKNMFEQYFTQQTGKKFKLNKKNKTIFRTIEMFCIIGIILTHKGGNNTLHNTLNVN